MANVQIREYKMGSIEDLQIEMVERKGKGHPDTICDLAVENLSRKLSQFYMDKYGVILHHNVDKCALAGGRSEPVLGGGDIIEPIYIGIIGRATSEILIQSEIQRVPIGILTRKAVTETLKYCVRNIKPDEHVQIASLVHAGSQDLVGLFDHGQDEMPIPLANDTSFGVSYAPFSSLENVVMKVENHLNSDNILKKIPAIGEDIKVMGLRQRDKIHLTVATAMVSSACEDISAYIAAKEEIKNEVLDLAVKLTDYEVSTDINKADIPEKEIVYITITGTSAECGDDGQVGRGNRVNGLITPMRPMSLEASAGKNPVSHVGKIYNVLAGQIAAKISNKVPGAEEVYVRILSQIGEPITEPLICDVEVLPEKGTAFNTIQSDAQAIAAEELKNITKLTEDFLHGRVTIC
ncbi:MAG: methionine adenosyltransferase [Candidatus Lokiarchaeota archaeon]|nr:methionine adenosyltransferase [Candidatus Lokiarchaeota archaeon]